MPINIQAVTIDRDDRLDSYCVTAKCSYRDFLQLTAGAEKNLEIQRSIIRGSKAYATLRADLKRGCVLPPIVLAANIALSTPIEAIVEAQNLVALSTNLSQLESKEVYVIDGLQRTNAIRQTLDELEEINDKDKFLDRQLRVEIWINISFGAIAYRMLLLNAGQRPMSVKHQVEVLSSKLVDDLSGIPNLDIFRTGEVRRRTQPGQFALAKLAAAFQAWLQGQPNLDLRNTVMEELLAESAIEVLGHTATTANQGTTGGFHHVVNWIVSLDVALTDKNISFLGNETVILGIASAVGALERSETLSRRVWPALTSLLKQCVDNPQNDPVGLKTFDRLRQGIDSSKVNVGVATRDMVFSAFKEFIRGAGETVMDECWRVGAAKD